MSARVGFDRIEQTTRSLGQKNAVGFWLGSDYSEALRNLAIIEFKLETDDNGHKCFYCLKPGCSDRYREDRLARHLLKKHAEFVEEVSSAKESRTNVPIPIDIAKEVAEKISSYLHSDPRISGLQAYFSLLKQSSRRENSALRQV